MIYVTSRFTVGEEYLLKPFYTHYKKLSVHKFLINFNSKVDNIKLKNLIDMAKTIFRKDLIYNVGPNDYNLGEKHNHKQLRQLVKKHTKKNDWIIPCDSDEFHWFDDNIQNIINTNIDYCQSFLRDRTTFNSFDNTVKDVNIKSQFPLFIFYHSQSKICLIRRELFFSELTFGHHRIRNDKLIPYYNCITDHYKWSDEGLNRIKRWSELWHSGSYDGLINLPIINKKLSIFNKFKNIIKDVNILNMTSKDINMLDTYNKKIIKIGILNVVCSNNIEKNKNRLIIYEKDKYKLFDRDDYIFIIVDNQDQINIIEKMIEYNVYLQLCFICHGTMTSKFDQIVL
jgi:hypothetical protein